MSRARFCRPTSSGRKLGIARSYAWNVRKLRAVTRLVDELTTGKLLYLWDCTARAIRKYRAATDGLKIFI